MSKIVGNDGFYKFAMLLQAINIPYYVYILLYFNATTILLVFIPKFDGFNSDKIKPHMSSVQDPWWLMV